MIFHSTVCRRAVSEKFLAVIILSLALLAAEYAMAQTAPAAPPAFSTLEEIYTVRNIAADETADTAAAARDIALQAARRVAFSRLTRRIVPPQDLARLPVLPDEALANLVRDFEVAGEKSRGQRYLASLTLRFDPVKFRDLLRGLNIRSSETAARAMLIIPVYDSAAGPLLWEANAWRDALVAAVASTGAVDDRLAPLRLPLGDIEDASALNASQAVAGDMQQLGPLIRRYGAGGVLLMQAVQSPGPGAAGGLAFDITLRRIGVSDEDIRIERIEGSPGEMAETILSRAALALVGGIQEAWLLDTAVDISQQASLDVVVQLSSFEDWLALQKRLTDTPMVRHIDLQALSVNAAQLNVQFLGTPEKLVSALSQHGLTLTQEAGKWVLRK
jgi:Uncharacterized protein conserved in bacteria (DUF2066)